METEKACKRARSCLVANALEEEMDSKAQLNKKNKVVEDGGMEEEMDSKAKLNKKNKVVEDGGSSFFDCHICLVMAREPIVTCCGHLFCWPCFYMLPYSSTTAKAKECPVCRGEVKDSALTPIYGTGNSKLYSGYGMVMIPPRPQAQRVEIVRQNRRLAVETLLQARRRNVFPVRNFSRSRAAETLQEQGQNRIQTPIVAETQGQNTIRLRRSVRVVRFRRSG